MEYISFQQTELEITNIDSRSKIGIIKPSFLMRTNNEVRKFSEVIYFLGFFVLFVLAITSGSFPIQITFIIVFIIGSFINTANNELKRKNLKPTRKNILAEMPTQLFAFVIGGLILAFAIYLIRELI